MAELSYEELVKQEAQLRNDMIGALAHAKEATVALFEAGVGLGLLAQEAVDITRAYDLDRWNPEIARFISGPGFNRVPYFLHQLSEAYEAPPGAERATTAANVLEALQTYDAATSTIKDNWAFWQEAFNQTAYLREKHEEEHFHPVTLQINQEGITPESMLAAAGKYLGGGKDTFTPEEQAAFDWIEGFGRDLTRLLGMEDVPSLTAMLCADIVKAEGMEVSLYPRALEEESYRASRLRFANLGSSGPTR